MTEARMATLIRDGGEEPAWAADTGKFFFFMTSKYPNLTNDDWVSIISAIASSYAVQLGMKDEDGATFMFQAVSMIADSASSLFADTQTLLKYDKTQVL